MMDLLAKLVPDGVESRNFVSFCLPSNAQLEDPGELNEWLERMVFLFEDIKWLLSLQVDDFWKQVLFDESCLLCLDSFLQYAPRSYDLRNVPDSCKVPLTRTCRLLLLVIKRLSMHDEDEKMKFTPDSFGEIIYENYVMDAARLLDICSIYYNRESNMCSLLEEILENIFMCQPKYYNDIEHAVNSMVDTLSNIDERLAISSTKDSKKNNDTASDLKPITGREAQDIVLFLFDMAQTLNAFIDVFPKSSQVFFKSVVLSRLAMFSESSLLNLLQLIEVNRKKYKYMCKEIEKSFLHFVSIVIHHGFIKSTDSSEALSSEFVTTMDAIAQCPKFMRGYLSVVNIDADFSSIQENGLLDNAALEYVKNMLGNVYIENDRSKVVKELLEILPEKSVEFINKCIDTYGPKVDVIMNNIMEGNISDESKVNHNVKKPLVVPNKDVLEDKEHVALLKKTLLSNDPGDDDDELSYNVYDDEYDDTYDSQNIAATDIDDFEEFTSRRKFTVPAALRQLGDVSEESDDGEEETNKKHPSEENSESSSQNRYKAPRGGRYQNGSGFQKGTGRGQGRGRGGGGGNRDGRDQNRNADGGNSSNQNPTRGVASNRGRGRGGRQKQNRRALADKKRSKGMMPF